MKKKIVLLGAILSFGITFSQVGINTVIPKATLDVVASPADNTKTDGFIAPRLKGSELKAKDSNYANDQTGAIVYVTEALAAVDTTAKTVNVTSIGYYYFDGTIWVNFNPSVAGASNDWHITGNAGTAPGNNFLGTTDAQELIFKVNNVQSGYMDYLNTKQNTAFGYNALVAGPAYNITNSNTTNNGNTAFGYEAMNSLGTVSGSWQTQNVAVGAGAMKSLVGGAWNTAIGANAMGSATGDPNVLGTMRNNVALGISALEKLDKGSFNLAIGPNAMSQAKTSVSGDAISSNIAMGLTALDVLNNGINNVALGFYAGNKLQSGSNNVFIGSQPAFNVTGGDQNIFIGYNVAGSTVTSSNEINIGNIIRGTGATNNTAATTAKKIGINTGTALPNSTLQLGGSVSLPIKSVTADYTITDADYKILVRSTGTPDVTLTLPDPATCAGRVYVIQNMNPDGGGVKLNYTIEIGLGSLWVSGNTALTGASSSGGYLAGTAVTLQSDGTGWTGITL